jgi:hypothetical protein
VTKLVDLVSERDLQALIVTLAKLHGWRTYHTHDSRRSAPGFPDLVLVRPPRLVFAELKTQRGRISPAQREWFEDLRRCQGVEVYLWKPSDRNHIARVLRGEERSGT